MNCHELGFRKPFVNKWVEGFWREVASQGDFSLVNFNVPLDCFFYGHS